jgi:transposase
LVTGHTTLERIAEAMLSARATLKAQYEKLHKAVLAIVREDAVCRRLMTVPGVGPVVAPSSRRWTIRAGSRKSASLGNEHIRAVALQGPQGPELGSMQWMHTLDTALGSIDV